PWSRRPWLRARSPAPFARRTSGRTCSFAPAGVDGVELALPRLEIELAELGGEHPVAVALVHFDDFGRYADRLAERGGLDLDLAGALEHVVAEEHRRQRLGHDHRAVIAQHQHAVVADVADQPLAFGRPDGDPLEVVVAD